MATGGRYAKCLRLLEKWPLDASKAGRDLGGEVREWVFRTFANGENTPLKDPAHVDKTIAAMSRIINDEARKLYKTDTNIRLGAVSASAVQCRQLISTETMAKFEDRYHRSLWRRLFPVFAKKHPRRVLPSDPVAAAEEIKALRKARWETVLQKNE